MYRLYDIGGCEIYFSYVRIHSGVLGDERADQLAKEVTGFDIDLPVSVPFSHFKPCGFGLELRIFGFFKGFVDDKIFSKLFFNDSDCKTFFTDNKLSQMIKGIEKFKSYLRKFK